MKIESHYPKAVIPLDNYKLKITFDNDEERIFDVEPYLVDPYFAPISNINIFKTAKINSITVEWLGEIDICPDELYFNSVLIS